MMKRRHFLRNVVSTSASLPFLMNLPSVSAQQEPDRRLITCFHPNGTTPSEYFPRNQGRNYDFKRILKPLESFKDRMIVFKGINIEAIGAGNSHTRGCGMLWTAAELVSRSSDSEGDDILWSSGPSIDQIVANRIGNNSRFKSLEYAVLATDDVQVRNRLIYRSSEQYIEPEQDPFRAFARLFGNSDSSEASQTASVLDAIYPDFERARSYLSQSDRELLSVHTDYIRDIERRLDTSDVSSCASPNLGSRFDGLDRGKMEEAYDLFADIITAAFACGLTKVGSLQWTNSGGDGAYPSLNIGNHHGDAHEPYNTPRNENCIRINTWYSGQLAKCAGKLDAVPDPSGNGSLLDNTIILSGNELGEGNRHNPKNIPFKLIGNLNGHFNTGQYIDYTRDNSGGFSHSRLLVSIQQAFGITSNRIGSFNEGPLARIS